MAETSKSNGAGKSKSEAGTEDTAALNWAALPKAKRHHLLLEASSRLKGCHKEGTFTVLDMRYRLRTLDPLDSAWMLQYIQAGDVYHIGKSTRAPTIAAAIQAVGPLIPDGADPEEAQYRMVPVAELFQLPPDLPAEAAALINSGAVFKRDWLRTEVFRWLCEPDGHQEVIDRLYTEYLKLQAERSQALEALGPLAKKSITGESSATSSPEKESS